MKNNETGEFELVMGNRQLLSGFFIVCLLFGVAFAMGYIVGRNSSPSARALNEMQAPAVAPVVSDTRPAAAVQPAPPPTESQKPSDPAAAPAPQPETTQPAQPVSADNTPEPQGAAVVAEPAPGNYWQVMAVKQPEAEVVMKTLKDKGFPTSLTPGPKDLIRVLVGPYNDRDSLGKAKADLENAGFHPILKK